MYFKLIYSIQKLNIKEEEEIFLIDDKIKVRLFTFVNNNSKTQSDKTGLRCEAIIELEPKEKVLEIFDKIILNEPLGFGEERKGGTTITTESKGTKYFIPSIDQFPEHFKAFETESRNLLSNAIKKTIRNIMWLYNYNGLHNPFASIGFAFSTDGTNWFHVPSGLDMEISFGEQPIKIHEGARKIINSSKNTSPIHHSIFLEAWNQKSSNKRSALIMGLSALESSIKYMIVQNVPNAVWIVENTPSPSIYNMLTEMLKTLPIKNHIDGKIKTLSKDTLSELRIWVGERNKIIHKGSELPKSFKITKILSTIKSIIYLMDYYSGEKWALSYVDKEILEN